MAQARPDHPRSRGVYEPADPASHPREGSSPLARGLLPARPGDGLPALGSSPLARGLRRQRPCSCRPGRDHPRSRGVYHQTRNWNAFHVGSSPLARGLPRVLGQHPGHDGIIPARAGFTSPPIRPAILARDHPRSRGVYGDRPGCRPQPAGSSPLARGLQGAPALCWAGTGIIPARAGFTCMAVSAMALNHGSSPLARGLPGVPLHVGRGHGIIPARAGFTRDGRRRRPWRADHPRSRGVYEALASGPYQGPGSSPLARGLPFEAAFAKADTRIIPARAGFTKGRADLVPREEDHPRSRGVYVVVLTEPALRRWIIPARAGFTHRHPGRHGRGRDHPRSRGVYADAWIIPARAGFTRRRNEKNIACSDHPRSRGVYRQDGPVRLGFPGSSPLARGLLPSSSRSRRPGRIIPARAGFTVSRGDPLSRGWDHPRSRGVYSSLARRPSGSPGSSPLARGLPTGSPMTPLPLRIIPARAGFTCVRPTARGILWDHPRSRGVYTPALHPTHLRDGSSPLARGLPASAFAQRLSLRIIPARAGFT